MTRADVDAYVEGRLSGTVWASSWTAKALYRRCMIAGRSLGNLGVTPNALTCGSLVLALAAGVAAALGQLLVAAGILLLSGVLDVLDGMVARATGRATRFGALLDSTVDRLSDALPLLGLVVWLSPQGFWVGVPAAAMVAAGSVSYVRARAESLGGQLPPLFMRRAERLVLLIATLVLSGLAWRSRGPAAPVIGNLGLAELLLVAGVGIMAVLSFAAAGVALWAARGVLEGEGPRMPAGERPRLGPAVEDSDSSAVHTVASSRR